MKKTLAAVTAAALIGVSGAANAADLYQGSTKDAPAYVPPPIWTGFYVGAHVGGLWSDFKSRDLNNYWGQGLDYGWKNNNSGAFGGGTVGYNWQASNWGIGSGNIVIGAEADFGGAGLSNNNWNNGLVIGPHYLWTKNDSSFYADVTGRLGYAWGQALIYAKGGWAYFDSNASVGGYYGAALTPWSVNNNNGGGWTVGGGIEYLWTPNWSIKAEYLYFDFSRNSVNWVSPVNSISYVFDRDLTVNSFKVGVNYHLTAPYAPLK